MSLYRNVGLGKEKDGELSFLSNPGSLEGSKTASHHPKQCF